MNKIKLTTAFFLTASVIDIIGVIFKIPILIYIFKPLIISSLIFLYTFSSPKRLKWYIIALEFSFFGDIFLLFTGNMFFMLGLSAFLLAHISYIIMVSRTLKKTPFNDIFLSFSIFFGFLLGLLFILKGHLGAMKIPVVIYGLVLSSFGAVSFINNLQQKNQASLVLLVGTLLFILSDSLLAINKFYKPLDILNVFVMLTYIAAQFVIFKGVILAEKKLN